MVRILKSAVKDNGHEEVIRVIPKHSTDVKVGPGKGTMVMFNEWIIYS